MNLAQLFQQKVTPLSQWTRPKEEVKPRKSSETRKKTHKNKVEQLFSLLTSPMTTKEMSVAMGLSQELCARYALQLKEDGRVRRSGKIPYKYWR